MHGGIITLNAYNTKWLSPDTSIGQYCLTQNIISVSCYPAPSVPVKLS